MARIGDVALWWKERSAFRLSISSQGSNRWQVEADCTPRATILARHVSIEDQAVRKNAIVEQVEELGAPLLRFGCWPNGARAALAVSGDIVSITVQDFFLPKEVLQPSILFEILLLCLDISVKVADLRDEQ